MSNPDYTTNQIKSGQPAAPVYRYTQKFLQEQSTGVQYSTWGPRFVAFFLDFLIVSVPYSILGNLFWIQKALSEGNADIGGAENATQLSFGIPIEIHYLLWPLVFGLYATLLTWRTGATVGKRLMNLQVVNASEEPLALPRLFLRYTLICYSVLATGMLLMETSVPYRWFVLLPGLVFVIGLVLALLDPKKQTLHDRVFRSYVILADPTRV